ncbi:hypothetical protein EON63_08965 [archaeon]|nr:MAG: hypothetical protein EON63_08965 [archaeon]
MTPLHHHTLHYCATHTINHTSFIIHIIHHCNRKAAVILIQRYWRGYMARQRAREIRQRNVDYQQAIAMEK